MKWKFTDTTNRVVFRTFDGGLVESMLVDTPDIQTWLAEGNTPEPADRPTPELLLAKKVQECQDYLNKTDFYYPRFLETGEYVPEEVVLKRKEARDFIRANPLLEQ